MSEISNGKGVFFHPPISVVDIDEEQDLEKPTISKIRQASFFQKLTDSIKIVVTKDGFIGVIMNKSDEKIIEFINVLIATVMSKGQRALFASEHDLCSFQYNFDKQTVLITSSEVFSLRNRIEFERDRDETYSLWRQAPRDSIQMKTISGWFSQALAFYSNKDLRNYLLLLGESWGLSYGKMYKASFLYSWMIIETALENYWGNHIDSLTLADAEKDIFRRKINKAFSIIEILKKISKMDEITFESIEKMRSKRNKLVHEMSTPVSVNDAHNCLM